MENTKVGMKIINSFPFWPGGKDFADASINSLGDVIGGILGWYSAKFISEWSNEDYYLGGGKV